MTKQTSSASDDLGSVVKDWLAAAEPIQGKFNGERGVGVRDLVVSGALLRVHAVSG